MVRDVYFVSGGGETKVPVRAAAPPPDVADDDSGPIDLPPLRDQRLAEVFARITRAHRKRRRDT